MGCFLSKNNTFINYCYTNDIYNIILLYSEGDINIRENNDQAFRIVCYYNFIDIAQWMTSIEDNYKILIVDNRIIKFWIKDIVLYDKIEYHKISNEDIHLINDECYICLESYELYQFNCRHGLCKNCLNLCLDKSDTIKCGLCNRIVEKIYKKI
jgi:hypothetical protein